MTRSLAGPGPRGAPRTNARLGPPSAARAGPVPAEQRSDQIRDTEPDPRRILTAWGAFVTEIAPRTAPILTLARDAAASDPELAALVDQVSAARLDRMTVNARALADGGHLQPGITVAQAADTLWAYSSPELYELLVLRRGWTPEHYGGFVAQAMIAALLPPTAPAQNPPAESPAPGAPPARPDQPDM